MASYVFDQVKKFVGSNGLGIYYDPVDRVYRAPDNTYRIVLCTNGALDPNNSSNTLWTEMSQYEITNDSSYNDDGYPNGGDTPTPTNPVRGSSLVNVGMSDIADAGGDCDDGLLDSMVFADNVTYNVSTIDADCAIVMRERADDDYDLITALDLRGGGVDPVRSNKGVFSLLLNSSSGGFLIIK